MQLAILFILLSDYFCSELYIQSHNYSWCFHVIVDIFYYIS